MKQNILRKLMLIAVLLTGVNAFSHDFEAQNSDGATIYYNITSSSNLTVGVTYKGSSYSSYRNEYSGQVTIPETVTYNRKSYSVTSIGSCAFENCRGLTSVTIPNSVTSIGYSAFWGCIGLTSVEIPNSVTSIGNYTFYGCSGLTSVTIPESVTSIGDEAFGDCSGLESIIVESGNTVYDSRDNCNAIIATSTNTLITGCKNTTIPESVTSIGSFAFSGCSSLTSVIIGNSVTSIGDDAFSYCSSLTSIKIPNSVTSIGNYTFYGCSGLTSITIPESVTSIGNSAFYGCSGLTSITIPESVTSIGNSAFSGCIGLISVTIPNSVTSIGSKAFYNCSGLTSVTIGNSVTSIGDEAFKGCSLTSVTCLNMIPPTCGTDVFYNVSVGNITLEVPEVSVSLYKSADTWKDFGKINALKPVDEYGLLYNIISETELEVIAGTDKYSGSIVIPSQTTIYGKAYNVTKIGSSAFRGCSSLTSVTIPESVTSIGDYAFTGCSGLTSVIIPDGVTSIGNYAFEDCSGLTSVTIGNSVTSIGNGAFRDCSGLTSVEIPNSVTSIGNYTFYGCSGLTSVEIPNSVTSIGSSAFSGCSSLTNITIPNSVTSIGNYAFDNCTSLKELQIEDGKSTLSLGYNYYNSYGTGEGLFYDCPLETLYLGRNIKYTDYSSSYPYTSYPHRYGYSAFYNTTTLKSVTIGNSVTSIGNSAFSGCSGLTSVVFNAENCTTMGSSTNPVFSGCTNLTSITIGDQVKIIPDYAFYNCSSLTSIKIPNSVTSIGSSAFKDCSSLTEVTLGNSVKEIDSEAFSGAKRLGKIYSHNPTPPTCADEDVFYNVNIDKCRVYVPVGAGEDYKTTYVWWDFTYIVEDEKITGVESIITENDVNVVVENGNIVVNGAEGANIEVYSTNGLCVYNGTDTGIAVSAKGLYIVRVNGKSFKVIL